MNMQPALYLALLLAGAASAAENSITIYGTIENSACTVSTGTADQTVELGDISSKQFYQAGAGSPLVPFTIDLENCTGSVSGATVTFSGKADGTNPSLLALDAGANAASGVGIALWDVNRTPVALNSPSSAYAIDTSKADNPLVFYAQYQSTAPSVKAGSATATATFTLTYQ